MKSIFLYKNISPYHRATLQAFRALGEDVSIVELAKSQREYGWKVERDGLDVHTLFDRPIEDVAARDQIRGVLAQLDRLRPAAVFTAGYNERPMRAALAWCKRNGAACIVLFPSTKLDNPRHWLKERVKSILLRQFDRVAVTGGMSMAYALDLGVDLDRIVVTGNVTDVAAQSDGCRIARTQSPPIAQPYFLSVNRLAPEKNILVLIKAFMKFRELGGAASLVIAGSGPEEAALKRFAAALPDAPIHFVGWKQTHELFAYYAHAVALVLPSTSEPWGLVVNEAMASALPVIVSKRCGCVPELVRPGVNGFLVDPDDVSSIANAMLSLMTRCDRAAMGAASADMIRWFTPSLYARSLTRCLPSRTHAFEPVPISAVVRGVA